MSEVPEADALEGFMSITSARKVTPATNLILSHGNDLSAIEPDAENASGMTPREITDEHSCLPVPYLHDGVVASTDDPFPVHTHAPHEPCVSVGVAFEAKHPSLAGDGTVSTGTQNDSVTTGVAHARDRRRHVLLVDTRHELQVGLRGGGLGRRYGVQILVGRPAFASADVNQSDMVV